MPILRFVGFSKKKIGILYESFRRLGYSRAEISAATRKWLMRRSELRRMGYDEVDVLRSARPEGVKDAA